MKLRFRGKFFLFVLATTLLPTAVLAVFLLVSFQRMTRFSLEQNTAGIIRTNEEALVNLATDKAALLSQQFASVTHSITILGKAAQNLIANYGNLADLRDVYEREPFRDDLVRFRGAVTNTRADEVNVLIPPSLTDRDAAGELLRVSSFLNLLIGPVFESDPNYGFVYFVGGRDAPITRAFPNIDLAEYLGPALDTLFWDEFFAEYVAPWEHYYRNPQFRNAVQQRVGSPITFTPPYEDAAGQGKVITAFYPLWDHAQEQFAGVVAADISLSLMLKNVLSIRVAETGYAMLINGQGEILAMPDSAQDDVRVQVQELERGGVKYYYRSLASSSVQGIRAIYPRILTGSSGYLNYNGTNDERNALIYASLAPVNDRDYAPDAWKILLNVPEREILSTLFMTHEAISARSNRTILVSFLVLIAIVAGVTVVTLMLGGRVTNDVTRLAAAADKIAAKDYELDIALRRNDEIGDLGKAFNQMSREIKATLDEKDVLLKEVHHRVKNNLQVISSLHRLQSDQVQDESALRVFRDSENRIQSMALIHEKLYQSQNLAKIDFAEYLNSLGHQLLRSHGVDNGTRQLKVDAENLLLGVDTAVPCGLIVNELISNALEHAFPGGAPGSIEVRLRDDANGRLELQVADTGIGLPEGFDPAATESLGLQLVTTLVDQLGGEMSVSSGTGTVFRIAFTNKQVAGVA